MKTAIHDTLIHIQSTLDDQAFDDLAQRIQQSRGVVSIGRDDQRPRFISIGYCPAHTSSIDILSRIVDCGHKACVVGNIQIMK